MKASTTSAVMNAPSTGRRAARHAATWQKSPLWSLGRLTNTAVVTAVKPHPVAGDEPRHGAAEQRTCPLLQIPRSRKSRRQIRNADPPERDFLPSHFDPGPDHLGKWRFNTAGRVREEREYQLPQPHFVDQRPLAVARPMPDAAPVATIMTRKLKRSSRRLTAAISLPLAYTGSV